MEEVVFSRESLLCERHWIDTREYIQQIHIQKSLEYPGSYSFLLGLYAVTLLRLSWHVSGKLLVFHGFQVSSFLVYEQHSQAFF